ncbi:hypothetical protein R1sor_001737 [Riccia sorocarpa]|uniref:Uncharacterized protein n=1 Tax=Riccia sorocarpa TaxID=122646 RepID=A0ABD3GWS6_9MARC
MVQPWRRSYFYFISFAKKKGIACAPRKGSVFARSKRVYKPLAPRPDWDNTIHDLSIWKLSPKELEARKIAFKTLPEHRFRRAVSSASPTLSSTDAPGADARTLTPCSAIGKSAAAEVWEGGSRKDGGNDTKSCSITSCVDEKENSSSGLLTIETHKQQIPSKRRGFVAATVVKPKAVEFVRSAEVPLPPPANALPSSNYGSGAEVLLTRCQRVAQETGFGGNQNFCTSPTVDFEKEVKQFEARAEFLVRNVRPPVKARFGVGKSLISIRPSYTLPNKLKRPNFYSNKGMEKSDSSDDDSLLYPPWGEATARFERNARSIPQQYLHRKNYNRKGQEVAVAAGPVTSLHEESKYNHYDPQPENELAYFKQPGDPGIKPRSKLAKRHFGSIQRTSPIGDWKVNSEDSASQHLPLQQIAEFQRHILQSQQVLIQEFKEFKLSISKQIMNLQLDVDAILTLQKKQNSLPAEPRVPSSHRNGKELPIAGVENLDRPVHYSMKIQKDVKRPALVSLEVAAPPEETSHRQITSSHNGPEHDRSRKSTHSRHETEPKSRPSSAPAGAAPQPQVFDNPIYHVQTSSDKEEESSDEDASVSSMELAKFLANRSAHQTYATGKHYVLQKEATRHNQGRNSANSTRQIATEDTKSYSLIPYGGHRQAQEAEPSHSTESDDLEISYRQNRADSNGHATADNNGLGKSSERNLKPNVRHYQAEDSRSVRKNGTPPSPGTGKYRANPPESEEERVTPRDLDLRLGSSAVSSGMTSAVNSGMTSTVNSETSSPKDYRNRLSPRVSRPLFNGGTWNNGTTNSSAALSNVKDSHKVQDMHDPDGAEVARNWQNGQRSKPGEVPVDREVPFTLRGWSAAFLQSTENVQKGYQSAQTRDIQGATPRTTATTELHQTEKPQETGKGTTKFPGRCAKGGVAWTVTEPPANVKKVRNASAA